MRASSLVSAGALAALVLAASGLAACSRGGDSACRSDFDDCGPGQICDLSRGACVDGASCAPDFGPAGCNFDASGEAAPGAACGGVGVEACVCDPEDSVCRKRRLLCEPCERDVECGELAAYERPAVCAELGGGRFCLAVAQTRACPSGYVQDPERGLCLPAEGACAGPTGCKTDDDCPGGICETEVGLCMRGCTFDVRTKESSCPDGQVCHQDGHCRAPCRVGEDGYCRNLDPAFVCVAESTNVSRCRVTGCLDDYECPVPGDGPYLGFCDRDRNVCVDDRCRPELTAHDGSNRDCRPSHGCTDQGECYQMDCAERGGALIACAGNDLCCGQCRNVTGNPDRDACDEVVCSGEETPSEGFLAGCVHAPNPPWCQPCAGASACTFSNPVEDARDVNLCIDGLCAPTCETRYDCPSYWDCQHVVAPGSIDCADGPRGADSLCPDDTRCAEVEADTFRCVSSKVCMPHPDSCP